MAQPSLSSPSHMRSAARVLATKASAVAPAAAPAAPPQHQQRRQRQSSIALLATSSPFSTPASPRLGSTLIPAWSRGSSLCASGGDGASDGGRDDPATPIPSSSIPSTTTTPLSSSTSPSSISSASPSSSSSPPGAALAAAAATLGVVLFAATRLSTGGITLADVAALSVPLDAALASGKPTIIEFYADYCDVCKALAPDSAAVARAFGSGSGGGSSGGGINEATSSTSPPPSSSSFPSSSSSRSLNFVLLNADNARWAPEIAEYGVRGVPHFVFLDSDGVARGAAVGRLPPGELEADAEDLVSGRPLSIGSHGKSFGGGGDAGGRSSGPAGEVTMLRGAREAPEPRAHG